MDDTWEGEILEPVFFEAGRAAPRPVAAPGSSCREQAELRAGSRGGLSAFAPDQTDGSAAEPGVQPSSVLSLVMLPVLLGGWPVSSVRRAQAVAVPQPSPAPGRVLSS